MRVTPLPEYQSEAFLPGQDFAPLQARIRRDALDCGLDLHGGHGRSIWCQVTPGEYGVRARGDGVVVFARAHRAQDLPAMQRAADKVLGALLPRPLNWTSGRDAGALPANFSLAELADVRPLCPGFLRVRLAGAGLARLGGPRSLHFRLIVPPPGDGAPEWPRLGANGQTLWPRGDQALHRPVYTVRAIDPVAGWLDMDVVDHPGGRVAQWVRGAQPGATVGLMGPSGGGIPDASRLLLAGDETACPAMARILEAAPSGTTGDLFLFAGAPTYPMPDAPGWRVHAMPGGAAALCDHLRRNPPLADAFLWMAAERQAIATLRTLVIDELGHDPALTHLTGYWTHGMQHHGVQDHGRKTAP